MRWSRSWNSFGRPAARQDQEFQRARGQGETLDDLLPEAFAVVREGSKRVMKMRHFDVQLMGGIALHQGKIAEMRTGEGKTLTATLPVYLNALCRQGRARGARSTTTWPIATPSGWASSTTSWASRSA
jgi:hypothetical protein